MSLLEFNNSGGVQIALAEVSLMSGGGCWCFYGKRGLLFTDWVLCGSGLGNMTSTSH